MPCPVYQGRTIERRGGSWLQYVVHVSRSSFGMILTRPHFYNWRCCIRIFDATITGAVQTSGSENITIVGRISYLIFGMMLLITISKWRDFRDLNIPLSTEQARDHEFDVLTVNRRHRTRSHPRKFDCEELADREYLDFIFREFL